mmetsp:Transcript_24236/g.80553  ORF Transcript_24236/g.80553 Transcript_24236/m.80553 type:complete len:254 (-) Transcript_24236:781-1542(-)
MYSSSSTPTVKSAYGSGPPCLLRNGSTVLSPITSGTHPAATASTSMRPAFCPSPRTTTQKSERSAARAYAYALNGTALPPLHPCATSHLRVSGSREADPPRVNLTAAPGSWRRVQSRARSSCASWLFACSPRKKSDVGLRRAAAAPHICLAVCSCTASVARGGRGNGGITTRRWKPRAQLRLSAQSATAPEVAASSPRAPSAFRSSGSVDASRRCRRGAALNQGEVRSEEAAASIRLRCVCPSHPPVASESEP